MADNIIKKPTPQEMAAAKLRETYVKAERAIIREITRKRNLGLVDYEDVASLKRVQEILTRMTTEADEYVPKMIESYFYTAEQIASAAGGYSNAMSLTVAQTSIVEQLVNNLLADIDDAAETAFKSAEKYLYVGRKEDDIFRKLALELTANKEAGVASRQTVQNMMAAELNAKGVTAFVDKAGREWSLESYCSMATRTTGRQAQVAAALTADDWDLWEIVKIGSTCPLCSAYEGRVYSKSGTDPDYPPLAMAFGKIDPAGSNDLSNTWLNLHPNCEHSLIRYTTAGKSEKQIERMKEFSSFEKRPADVDYRSKKQIEAYRNKEAERARYRADVKQFEKYKAAGVEGMPVNFETFEKHKRAGDDVYKGWESKFRSMSRKDKSAQVSLKSETSPPLNGALQGLKRPLEIESSDDIKAFAETLLGNLNIDLPVKMHGMYGRDGECVIKEGSRDIKKICHFESFDLNSADSRSTEYRVKTAFHESYHAMLDGRPWDAVKWDSRAYGYQIDENWRTIEETFAESSAHYVAQQYGITKKLMPAYPYELSTTLPKLKRLKTFQSCETIQDFGRIAHEARKAGKGEWTKLQKQIKKVKLPKDYQAQYYEYIRQNKNKLLNMILETEPSLGYTEASKAYILEKLETTLETSEKTGLILANREDSYYQFLVAAMQMIGVK